MSHQEFPFLSLLLITALAASVPLLAARFKKLQLPIVVGEIIAGMIVGQSGLNLIEPSQALEFLTIFGFTYLMFISGLEVDFSIITNGVDTASSKRRLANPLTFSLVVFLVTIGLAFVAAEILLQFGLVQEPFIIALILSTTSLGIVVPVLKERNLMRSRFGQTLLMSALVADFGTLIFITIDIVIMSRGVTPEVLLVFLLLATFALVVRVGRIVAKIPGLPRLIEELSHATAQIQVRGAMALMVAFIALSQWLGIEVILGAFLAGAVISLLAQRESSQLRMKMDAIGFGFFIPIFFIMVGVQFDLPSLLTSSDAMLLVPLLLAIAYAVKFVAALLYRTQFSWRQTFAAGGLLSARLSLIIAAAAIALDMGIINQAIDSAIILVAIVTCTISPLIFNRVLPPVETEVRRGIIIVGLGEMATLLAERLLKAGEPVTIIGFDRGRKRSIRRQDLPVVTGDPTKPDVLAQIGAASARALIAMSTYDDLNLAVCRLARKKFNIPHIVAQASDPRCANKLAALGAHVVQPQLATVLALHGALNFPAAFDLLADQEDGVEIREVELNSPRWDGQLLRRVLLPGDALVMGLRRSGEVLVPHGDTRLKQGDLLMLIGHEASLQQAVNQLDPLGEMQRLAHRTNLN
ncbi:MAG: cation:proton antiporter [Anaerolineae bacterium]|nr:cation:proton antiporter [Anaerolineae bacterium]